MRSMIRIVSVLTVILVAGSGAAQNTFHDRNAVPGFYTVGLYGDASGSTTTIVLEADQLEFDAWVGLTGDSTRVFSGTSFGLDLPRRIEINGAIRWNSIPGLQEWGVITAAGVQAEFAASCVQQQSHLPTMLGRIRFRVDDDFESGEITMRAHVKHGLSVELCYLDGDWWPKPFATAVSLTVERKQSFWSRLRNLFR